MQQPAYTKDMPPTIDATLRQISRQTEERAAMELAARLGLVYTDLNNFPFSLEVIATIPIDEVKEHQTVTYLHSPARAKVGIVRPEDPETQKYVIALQQQLEVPVEVTVISASSLQFALMTYAKLSDEKRQEDERQVVLHNQAAQHDYFRTVRTLDDLQKKAGQCFGLIW